MCISVFQYPVVNTFYMEDYFLSGNSGNSACSVLSFPPILDKSSHCNVSQPPTVIPAGICLCVPQGRRLNVPSLHPAERSCSQLACRSLHTY